MSNITIRHEGRFWFVLADGETLGHAYKVIGFEGESGWKSAFRIIFRPLWRASASSGDEFIHLEELYGSVFRSRPEAVGGILAFHNMSDKRYPPPVALRGEVEGEP